MRLETIYVRFFRSLNYDYLRKARSDYAPDPWDATPQGSPYPFVRLRLEPDITTIVGANESGKSQLLAAIKAGLTGDEIERGDFCRYSPYFSRSALTHPEFGLRFVDLSADDAGVIKTMCALDGEVEASRAALFRVNETPKVRLYLEGPDGWAVNTVRKPGLLRELGVPQFFEINSKVPLPDVVPIGYVASGELDPGADWQGHQRRWERIRDRAMQWFSTPAALREAADEVVAALGEASPLDEVTRKKFALADDLLIKVAGLDRNLFAELRSAISEGRGGYAGGIIETINQQLAAVLNFPHWWSQDTFFELRVDHWEHDLVFMIRDRTGTTYSFDERSEGLKYFLSYFVQYLSHQAPDDGRPEILLMDEPDAYLSASGQQDLLRIFDAFAHPEEPSVRPVQVVYVTHSPFLIDKNHAERIRVLEKGEHDEGTRVVANASRNHYEPLRSALGSFVGETTFIGACNLVLEGLSDQILIAGISSWLTNRVAASQRLDLNTITLVPAGGAAQVPYLVFLARGRDVDRPPIVVLLDGDAEGDRARSSLARGGARRRQLIAPASILQLSDRALKGISTENPNGPAGIEDLFSAGLLVAGAKRYCQEFAPESNLDDFSPTAKDIYASSTDGHKGVQTALREHLADEEFDLDKVGFARNLLTIVRDGIGGAAVETTESNFVLLLTELAKRQRLAERETNSERISSRVNRAKRRFLADHQQDRATREEVTLLIEEIEAQLDQTLEAEEVRAVMRGWRRDFALDDDPRSDIEDYPAFVNALRGLAYAGQLKAQEAEPLN